ncbi:MAG: lipopolysaccharide kinase InaA family protein, partial [Longimicrobiales bacterium]
MAGPAEAAGYAVERERGALVVALPSIMQDVLALLRQHGTLYAAAAARPDSQAFTGRGAAYRMAREGGDWLVRHYRRGGAAALVLRDEYLRLGEPRPLRELHASIRARALGVDTPEVFAAIAYLSGPLYRG